MTWGVSGGTRVGIASAQARLAAEAGAASCATTRRRARTGWYSLRRDLAKVSGEENLKEVFAGMFGDRVAMEGEEG